MILCKLLCCHEATSKFHSFDLHFAVSHSLVLALYEKGGSNIFSLVDGALLANHTCDDRFSNYAKLFGINFQLMAVFVSLMLLSSGSF